MTLLEELKTHLDWEFSNHNKLNEMRGMVGGVNDIVNYVMNNITFVVDRAFSKTNLLRRCKITFNFDVSELGTFFDSCIVKIDIKRRGGETHYNGSFTPEKSLIEKDGKLTIKPFIAVEISSSSRIRTLNLLRLILGHEFTHAYNSIQYGVKNNKTKAQVISNTFDDQHYRDIQTARTSKEKLLNRNAIGHLNYLLNRMERNANIAQLEQELEDVHGYITDSKSAMEAIRATESWDRYRWINENIRIINNEVNDDVAQQSIIESTNIIMGTKFRNFEEVKKYYNTRWNIWRTKYLTAASKIAYEVYERHNGSGSQPARADNQRQG